MAAPGVCDLKKTATTSHHHHHIEEIDDNVVEVEHSKAIAPFSTSKSHEMSECRLCKFGSYKSPVPLLPDIFSTGTRLICFLFLPFFYFLHKLVSVSFGFLSFFFVYRVYLVYVN